MKRICQTKAYKELSQRNSRPKIKEGYIDKLELLEKTLNAEYTKLNVFFDNYTKHDWEHTIKVLDYMYDLIDNPSELSEEEIMLIIYVALLHDIGMACDDDDASRLIPNSLLEARISQYLRVNLRSSHEDARKACITDIIRGKHGIYAEERINDIANKIDPKSHTTLFKLSIGDNPVDNYDLVKTISVVCRSHMETVNWAWDELSEFDISFIFIACLLRIADLLDIDIERADVFYQSSRRIHGTSGEHYVFNQMFTDSNRIKDCSTTCKENCPNREENRPCDKRYKKITFSIASPQGLGHESAGYVRCMVNDFREALETEILDVKNIQKNYSEEKYKKYHIRLDTDVECIMKRVLSSSSGSLDTHRLTVDYSAIKALFSGDQIYNGAEVGLREIIQNAYDACKAFSHLKHNEKDWEAKITITLDSTQNIMSIRDNGIGMTEFEIKEYFLNIGKSIYHNTTAYLYDDYHTDHIGHFGLGFYASFLLSEKIMIKTQSNTRLKSTVIELDKNSNFAILTCDTTTIGHGTEVIIPCLNSVQIALELENFEDLVEYICSYISETFLADGIRLCLIVNEKSINNFNLISLPIESWDTLDGYLERIQASAEISSKTFPPIYFAEGTTNFTLLEYDDLLIRLARQYNDILQIPYLDAGDFLIFPDNKIFYPAFYAKAVSVDSHTNYSSFTPVCENASMQASDFCKAKGLQLPKHCNYYLLDIIKDGNNSVLCDKNIPCAKKRHIMRVKDACGDAQLDDKVYLRDVLLPRLHITLPCINFRYNFDGFIANIKTLNVFPTLLRETLTNDEAGKLSLAIGYAISKLKADTGEAKVEDALIVSNFYKNLTDNIFIEKGK